MVSPYIRRSGDRPYVIGHRGALARAPENTLASFRLGARLGADAVELDIWRTSDGVPIAMHDETLDRTTNGHGRVRETVWSEIQRLDAGSHYSADHAGEAVPALDDVLRWARSDRVDLVLEIKQPIPASGRAPDAGLVASVVAAVRAHDMADRALLISFHHPSIADALALDPTMRTGLLTEGPELIDPLAATRVIPGVIGLHVRWYWVSERLCREAHEAGMHVHAWGMARPIPEDAVRRVLSFGVDTLSADAPDELVQILDAPGYGSDTR